MKKTKKASRAIEINKKLRRTWDIRPVTKIKLDERCDIKKRRQNDNEEIKRFNIDEIK